MIVINAITLAKIGLSIKNLEITALPFFLRYGLIRDLAGRNISPLRGDLSSGGGLHQTINNDPLFFVKALFDDSHIPDLGACLHISALRHILLIDD